MHGVWEDSEALERLEAEHNEKEYVAMLRSKVRYIK
jgi:hypothetical protein